MHNIDTFVIKKEEQAGLLLFYFLGFIMNAVRGIFPV